MQAVNEAGSACGASRADAFFGLGLDIDGAGRRINDRRRSDADFREYVVGGNRTGIIPRHGSDSGREEASLPELEARRRIGVEGVDAIVISSNEYNVSGRWADE